MKVARGAKFQGKQKFNKPQGLDNLKKFGKAQDDDDDSDEDDDSEDDDAMNIDDALEFDDSDHSGTEASLNKTKNLKNTPSKNIQTFEKTPGKKTPNARTNNTPLNKNVQTPGKNVKTPAKNIQIPGQNVKTPGNKTPLKLLTSPTNKFTKQQLSGEKKGTPNQKTKKVNQKSSIENKASSDDDDDDEEDDENSTDEEEEDDQDDDGESDEEAEDDESEDEENRNQLTKAGKISKEKQKIEPKINLQNKELFQDKTHQSVDAKRQENSCTLFVKNLPDKVQQSDLLKLSPDILQARLSQRAPWFAFLSFTDESTAVKNYQILKEKVLMGKQIFVDYVGDKSSKHRSTDTQGEVDPYKLFVGQLSPNTTEDMLVDAFPENTGILIPKRKNFPPRFAFVSFKTPEAAKKAFDKMQNAQINNSPVKVMFANKRPEMKQADKRKPEPQNKFQPQKKIKLETPMKKQNEKATTSAGEIDPCRLFVAKLSLTTTEDMLREAFPDNIEVFIPRKKKGTVRFGFVSFKTPEDAKRVHDKMQNIQINNETVAIAYANKRTENKQADKRPAQPQKTSQLQKKIKLATPKNKQDDDSEDDDSGDDDSEDDDNEGEEIASAGSKGNESEDDDDDEDDDE